MDLNLKHFNLTTAAKKLKRFSAAVHHVTVLFFLFNLNPSTSGFYQSVQRLCRPFSAGGRKLFLNHFLVFLLQCLVWNQSILPLIFSSPCFCEEDWASAFCQSNSNDEQQAAQQSATDEYKIVPTICVCRCANYYVFWNYYRRMFRRLIGREAEKCSQFLLRCFASSDSDSKTTKQSLYQLSIAEAIHKKRQENGWVKIEPCRTLMPHFLLNLHRFHFLWLFIFCFLLRCSCCFKQPQKYCNQVQCREMRPILNGEADSQTNTSCICLDHGQYHRSLDICQVPSLNEEPAAEILLPDIEFQNISQFAAGRDKVSVALSDPYQQKSTYSAGASSKNHRETISLIEIFIVLFLFGSIFMGACIILIIKGRKNMKRMDGADGAEQNNCSLLNICTNF